MGTAETGGAIVVPAPALSLGWREPTGIVRLSLINFGLNILTVGFYQFWAKADIRRRIWASVRIAGEPLSYAGTGRELLIGFLTVFLVVMVPALLVPLAAYAAFGNAGLNVAQVALYATFAFLFGLAVWRAQRYRLSRTSWRGIRLDLKGSSWGYAWTAFWTAILIPLTLGWISPWRSTKLQRMLVEGMRFGDQRFSFSATTGPLYARYLVVWFVNFGLLIAGLAAIGAMGAVHGARTGFDVRTRPVPAEAGLAIAAVIIGLLALYGLTSAWYRAAQFNHFARATVLGDVRFDGHMTGRGLFFLTLTNWIVSLASLGILTPLAQKRAARYMIGSLEVIGGAGLETITQAPDDPAAARGEGLAYALNFDAF